MNQIKKNFIYNVLYQILTLILPIVSVPYVSRVLGADGVGVYSYTYSIVNYFMIISMLGINNYGNRTIAKVRNIKDKNILSKNFFCIYFIQLAMTSLMIIIYLIYILIFNVRYKLIAVIQIIFLISVLFDINWFFFGLEKFKITVTRSTILKLFSFVLILLLVKKSSDIWIYTLILAGSTLLSQLLLFPLLKKEINIVKIRFSDIKIHIKPCLILFIPVIAVSLYKIMDKIMLGHLSIVSEVGYYEQAEKIVSIPLGIVSALGTVMLPRVSYLVEKGDSKTISRYLEQTINFIMFLTIPMCFGIFAISKDFVLIFLGSQFEKSAIVLNYLIVTVIFISFANIIRTQYLIPKERDKDYIISVCIGAIVNLFINMILIPKYASIGACIGTVIAEFMVMFYQTMVVIKEMPIYKYIKEIAVFFIKAIIMYVCIVLIKLLKLSSMLTVILQIILGISIYFTLNYKYINEVVDIKKYIKNFKFNKSI